jgi:hypothetical protein
VCAAIKSCCNIVWPQLDVFDLTLSRRAGVLEFIRPRLPAHLLARPTTPVAAPVVAVPAPVVTVVAAAEPEAPETARSELTHVSKVNPLPALPCPR